MEITQRLGYFLRCLALGLTILLPTPLTALLLLVFLILLVLTTVLLATLLTMAPALLATVLAALLTLALLVLLLVVCHGGDLLHTQQRQTIKPSRLFPFSDM